MSFKLIRQILKGICKQNNFIENSEVTVLEDKLFFISKKNKLKEKEMIQVQQ